MHDPSSRKGILYGVGVGPGDPDLLTIKAARIIRTVPVLALPDSGSGDSAVRAIAGDRLDPARVLALDMPMSMDPAVLAAHHDAAFLLVRAHLDAGRDVAFLTLGDPSVYSTFTPLLERAKRQGYDCVVVPGVPSFCAIAARLLEPLAERNERLTILPAPYGTALPEGNAVVMKVGRHLPGLLAQLDRQNRLDHAALAERCGMPGERIRTNLDGSETTDTYFSTLIIKEATK